MKSKWWGPVILVPLLAGCGPQHESPETFAFPPSSKTDPFRLPRVIEIPLPRPAPEEIQRPSPPLKKEEAKPASKPKS
jgi:hypothetical protein